jgi:arylsulfatase
LSNFFPPFLFLSSSSPIRISLIEAAGLELLSEFQGRTLLPTLRRTELPEDETIFFEHYGAYWGLHPFRVVRTREWKYVKYYGPDQTEELYHLSEDPHELWNLARDAAAAPIRAQLESQVDAWWWETGGREYAYYESPEFKASGQPVRIE